MPVKNFLKSEGYSRCSSPAFVSLVSAGVVICLRIKSFNTVSGSLAECATPATVQASRPNHV